MLLPISLCLIFLLAACGDSTKETEEPITVMLDWYPNALHSFLYVAEEKGYFEDAGLDVEFRFPANPTDPLTLAATDKVTIGLYYQPDVIMARANEGVPIKSIASIVREPLNHLVYHSDNPINSPKELVGKKVGYPGIPINEALVKTMVEFDGGDYEQVELINVEFELGSSLISEQVDAVSGMFVNHEVPSLRSQGHELDYINPVDYGVPSYHEVVAVTSDNTWEKRQDEIIKFWHAATKAYEFMVENEEAALQILLDFQDEANFPLDKDVEMESLQILLPKMESDTSFGSQNLNSWEETANWLKSFGLIEEIPEMDDVFVNIEL